MDNKLSETLPTWVTPRLMRLNQADGTDKHVSWTEGVTAPSPQPTCSGGGGTGQTYGGGPCGPS